MVVKHIANGFQELEKLLVTVGSNKLVLLFTGSATATSPSWCPDCVKADPIVEKVVDENKDINFDFAQVFVGSREEWRDPKCPFRVDARFKLNCVPTLMIWGSVQRLNDSECQNIELVRMLFEEL